MRSLKKFTLSPEEREIARGARGPAAAAALQAQIKVGTFFGATRFVKVSHAHATVDFEVMGEAGIDYLDWLVSTGARVAVRTTRNSRSVCPALAGRFRQAADLVDGEVRVERLLAELGVEAANACVPYEVAFTPRIGEHVAWGDTGAATYANGVLGARTNFEGGIAGVWAALTGRTPAFGFHLDAARRANALCRVEAPLRHATDWAVLGAVIGEQLRGYETVPAIDVGDVRVEVDQLKGLAAAIASYGSIAMFHVIGITPEAATLATATGGRDVSVTLEVTSADIEAYYRRSSEPEGVNLVVFTAPQLSEAQLTHLDALLDGRRFDPAVTVIVTTSPASLTALADGPVGRLREAGAIVVDGTCWYLMDPGRMRTEFGWRRVLTDSPKLANIIPASGYVPIVRPTADCIEAAITRTVP